MLKYREDPFNDSTKQNDIRLIDLHNIIKSDKYKMMTYQFKNLVLNNREEEFKKLKSKSSAIAVSTETTDIIQIDIDLKDQLKIDISHDEIESIIEDIREMQIKDNNFYLIYNSVSRLGIKGLLRIDKKISAIDNIEYNKVFPKIRQYIFNKYLYDLGLSFSNVDKSIHYCQICYVGHDEKCYYNDNPEPILINDLPDYIKEEDHKLYNYSTFCEDDIEFDGEKIYCKYEGKLQLSLALVSFNVHYMNLQKDDVIKLIVGRYVKKRQSLSKMVKIINSDFKKYDKIPSFFSWTKIKANIIKKY